MKGFQGFITLRITLVSLGLGLCLGPATWAAPGRVAGSAEKLALSAKKQSITALKEVLVSRKNSKDEPALLLRLAETYQDVAALEFRLFHSQDESKAGTPESLDKNYIKLSVDPLNRLVQTFPKALEVPRALYLRGKAKRELGDKDAALIDFKTVSDNYPNAAEMPLAVMQTAELMVARELFRVAIEYLKRLENRQGQKYFPLVMTRIAWAYHSLNELAFATSYLGKLIRYLAEGDRRQQWKDDFEQSLKDLAIFYADGIAAKQAGFDVVKAYPYFKSLNPGALLAKTSVQFAYGLRAKGEDAALSAFTDTVTHTEELDLPSRIEILLCTLEHISNRHKVVELKRSALEMAALLVKLKTLYKEKYFAVKMVEKVKKSVTEVAASLQGSLTLAKNQKENADTIRDSLIEIYQVLIALHPDLTPSQATIQYNLAELLDQKGEFEKATQKYRAIALKTKATAPPQMEVIWRAYHSALLSRYEVLKAGKLIPENLAARSLVNPVQEPVAEAALEWIDWIDHYPVAAEKAHSIEPFRYETARIYYSKGQLVQALQRFKKITDQPKMNEFTIPTISLLIDTYVLSQEWNEALDFISGVLKKPEGPKAKNPEFALKLEKTNADISFKLIELAYQKKDYPNVLKSCDSYREAHKDDAHVGTCLTFSANASLELQDKAKAALYFEQILKQKDMAPETIKAALLTTASFAEDVYDFDSSVMKLKQVLARSNPKSLSTADARSYKQRILTLSWLFQEPAASDYNLKTKDFCEEGVSCRRISVLKEIQNWESRGLFNGTAAKELSAKQKAEMFKRFFTEVNRKGSEESVIFSVLLMGLDPKVSYEDRFLVLKRLSEGFSKLDSTAQLAVIPALNQVLQPWMHAGRKQLRGLGKLSLNEKAIKRRVGLMDRADDELSKLLDVPLLHVKAAALNEIAGIYADFSADVHALKIDPQVTAEVTADFDKKRDKYRQKAFELVSEAGVSGTLAIDILTPLLEENAELKKDLEVAPFFKPGDIAGLSTLNQDVTQSAFEKVKSPLKEKLLTASKDGKLLTLAFLVEEGLRRKELSEAGSHAFRSLMLSKAGAPAESFSEFLLAAHMEENVELKAKSLAQLALNFSKSLSKAKTKLYLDELNALYGETPPKVEFTEPTLAALKAISKWATVKLAFMPADEDSKTAPRSPAAVPKVAEDSETVEKIPEKIPGKVGDK